MKSYIKNKEGVAAVEFALIAPFLVFFMIGVFDYGTYMNDAMKIENTARATAAYLYEGGEEDNLDDDVFLPSTLGLTLATIDSLTSSINYVCECTNGEETDCESGCTADILDPDDSDTYMRRYLEVTLSMSRAPLMSYPGLSDSQTVAGFVRLQIE